MREGAEFFRALLEAPIPKVAVENPVMHKYAVDIIGRRQDQTVQPYQFGHSESKRTALWLRGLPPLEPTTDLKAETMARHPRDAQRLHYLPPGPDRWKERSRFYTGIAQAMAEQWS